MDHRLRQDAARAGNCTTCGACCDFAGYDHRLFVTTPELIYLAAKLGTTTLEPSTSGRCPYQRGAACDVHAYRFAGCRIFCCHGDAAWQGELSEDTLRRLKAVCERHDVPYQYMALGAALARFNDDTCRSVAGPCPADRTG
jgi:hypothetical protein